MPGKWIIGLVLLIAAGLGLYYYAPDLMGTRTPTATSTPQQSTKSYTSNAHRISFSYPGTYVLAEHEVTEGIPSHVITLMDKDAAANVPENGEGPQSIAISIFNSTTTDAETWVRTSPASNFDFSRNQLLTSVTVAQNVGVKYTTDGLYATDNIAIVRNGKVYLFSVGWISPDDDIVKDFEQLLTTVQLQ